MSPKIPKSIALVDFLHMLTVHFKATASDAGPNDAGQRTLNDLAAIRQASEHVVVCMDSPPYWRKTVHPEYKAGREREPEFSAIVKWTVERLHADGYNVAAAPGEEADDVIATLAESYSLEYDCGDIRIVGADKDALQLVTQNGSVRCFVPKGRGEFEIRDWDFVKKTYGVEPPDFALFLAIMGDASDKIPGIKGIGKVGAAKLINAYKNPAGMAVACVAQVEASKVTGKLPAFWRDYAAGMADLPKWLRLTTLKRDAALEKHPLKYLEKLPMQKLVDDDPVRGTDDYDLEYAESEHLDPLTETGVDWDKIAAETEERERAEMAASLPVGHATAVVSTPAGVFEPRIGKDPKADEHLQREALMRENERKVTEARERHPLPPGKYADPERFDRHGQPRPDTTVMDPKPDPMKHVPPEAQRDIRALGEQLGKEGAAAANGAPASTPQAAAAAEVVPKSTGPRKVDAIPSEAALVQVEPPSWSLAVQPRTANEMLAIAKTMINSRYFSAFGTPEGVFAVMALGRELGLGMAQALQGFFIVQNKPFASSAMLRALVQKHPDCAYFICTHSDDKSATFELRRKSWPEGMKTSLTYTWEQAVAAKLTTGGNAENWRTKPTEMLSKTAAAKLARRDFADATFGLHTESEIE